MNLPLVIITAVDQLRSFVATRLSDQDRGRSNANRPLPVYRENLPKVSRLASARALEVSIQVAVESSPLTETVDCARPHQTFSKSTDSRDLVAFIGPEGGESELLALLHASYTDRAFMAFAEIPAMTHFLADHPMRSMLCFVPAQTFDLASVTELKSVAPNMRLGLWPYVDPADINHFTLKNLLFRRFPPRPTFLVIDRADTLTARHLVRERAGDTEYCDNQSSTLDHLEQSLQGGDLLELNYLSHCRECTLRFKDFFYCGRSCQWPSTSAAPKLWPCCHYDDHCYIRDKRKVDAASLNASIFMLVGCNLGDLNNSVVPYHFNVVARLLDGSAVSLTTTAGIRTAHFVENILAHQLLTHGYSEGDKVHFLNQFLKFNRLETVDYLLFGDPQLRIAGNGDASTSPAVTQEGHDLCVEIPETRGDSFFEIDLPEVLGNEGCSTEDCVGCYCLAAVHPRTSAVALLPDRDLFYCVLKPDHARARLLVFSNLDGLVGVSMRLTTRDVLAEKLERLLTYRQSLSHLRELFTIRDVGGECLALDNSLKFIMRHHSKHRYSLYWFTTIAERIEVAQRGFETVFEKAFRQLVADTRRKRNNYFETALERYLEIASIEPDRCSSCHASVTPSSCRNPSLGSISFRRNVRCNNCNTNQDLADTQLILSSSPRLRFDDSGKPLEVLRIDNRHDHPVSVRAAMICLDSPDLEVDPTLSNLQIDPGESHHLKMTFQPGAGLNKGYYLFSFYVMAEGKFYYLSNMIGFE